jgi:hypothetical protein
MGANVIDGSKKINVRANIRPKKVAKLFSNGCPEPLSKVVFNNGSLKEPLLNGSAVFWYYESLF